jgi:hypothetical protein
MIIAKESKITAGPSTRTGTKPTGLSLRKSERYENEINKKKKIN